jgi:parallel beta-helix repeat protein
MHICTAIIDLNSHPLFGFVFLAAVALMLLPMSAVYTSSSTEFTVSNELRGIIVSESHNNEIYNNTVSNSGSGIEVSEDSYDNLIYGNVMREIQNPSYALIIEEGAAEQNKLNSNKLMDTYGQEIDLYKQGIENN